MRTAVTRHKTLKQKIKMKLIIPETYQINPWAELDRLLAATFATDTADQGRTIPANLYETEDAKILEFELPGVARKDIDLSYDKGVLSIEATRKVSRAGEENVIKLQRSVRIGTEIDFKKVEARLDNGILTVSLPRREQDKPLRISVN